MCNVHQQIVQLIPKTRLTMEKTYASHPKRKRLPCDRIADPSQPFNSGGYVLHLQFGTFGADILQLANEKREIEVTQINKQMELNITWHLDPVCSRCDERHVFYQVYSGYSRKNR